MRDDVGQTIPWYSEEAGLFGPEYLEEYEEVATTERARADVDFLERELGLEPGMKILDLACGHGRHSIELASRGYEVTGLDLNSYFLERAKESAHAAGVQVRWIKSDMRHIPFSEEFDDVISMFTSFGFLESDEEDQKVLHAVAKALRSEGYFVLDVRNRDELMRSFTADSGRELQDQSVEVTQRVFDFQTSRMNEKRLRVWPDGRRREIAFTLRLYSLHELINNCCKVGLRLRAVFGSSASEEFGLAAKQCILITQKRPV